MAEGDGLLAATARFREPPEVEEAAEEAVCEEVDVSALIEDGERRGVSGLLLVRVVAAHDLVNADWWSLSDPYAKAIERLCLLRAAGHGGPGDPEHTGRGRLLPGLKRP